MFLSDYDGAHCPTCGASDIQQDSLKTTSDIKVVVANCECSECGAMWEEVYSLIGCEVDE